MRRTGLAVALAVMVLGPVAIALAASGTFTGITSQGNACAPGFKSPCLVRVEVANGYVGHKHSGQSHVAWAAKCQSGKNVVYSDVTGFWGPLKNGSLTVHGHYVRKGLGPNGSYSAHNNVTINVHVGQKAVGSVIDSSVIEKGTTVVNRCHTGTITFAARR